MIKVNELKVLSMIENEEYNDLKKYIETEVKLQSITNKSDKQKIKAIARFSKYTKKLDRDQLQGAFEVENKTMIVDGYRGLILDGKLEDFPGIHVKDNDTENFDLRNIFNITDNHKPLEIDLEDFMLQYKKYKAANKKERKENSLHLYKLKENLHVNIQYLKDMHDMLDLSVCKIHAGGRVDPIYIFNEKFFNAKGILLPIRVD